MTPASIPPSDGSSDRDTGHDLDWDLLDRHLANACDAEESARAEAMLRRHPVAWQLMQRLGESLDASDARPTLDDKTQLAERLFSQIVVPARTVTTAPAASPTRGPVARPRLAATHQPWITSRAALGWASAAVAGLALVIGLSRAHRTSASAPERVYATHRGERVTIRLADGSSVVLGAQSTLRYDETFGRDHRDIYLDGEAYFTVAHHAGAPFVVYTAHSATQVLGTQFFVKAYPADPNAEIAVTDGKVAFRARSSAPGSGISLVHGDVARIDRSGLMTVARDVPVDAYADWTRGRLPFVRAKLGDVAAELERWYDISIVITDPTLARASVSVTLDTESADQAMTLLADITHASWTRSGRTITLSPQRRS